MSYIITDGTRYCHRTETRAVEIVSDRSQATVFTSRLSAEKLLARATKKLAGFRMEETGGGASAPARRPAPAAADKTEQAGSKKTQQQGSAPAQESRKAQQQGSAPAQEGKNAQPKAAAAPAGKKSEKPDPGSKEQQGKVPENDGKKQ